MNFSRFPLPLFLLLVPTGAHCDPSDEGPPPATPASEPSAEATPPSSDPPPPATPPEVQPPPPSEPSPLSGVATAPPSAPPPDDTAAASGEYAVGEDTDSYEDDDPAALTDFRPALDPYGGWVDDPTYGTVWVPSADAVGADFQPYVSSGHWAYDTDWVWVSDYPWGWAPFHYGRWIVVPGRGWSWIPGRIYRGAWVDWSVDDGYAYLGWAPAPPLFLWFGGSPVGWGRYLGRHWTYCPRAAVFAPAVATRVVASPAAVALATHMRLYVVPASTRVAGGPSPERLGYAAAQIPRPPSDAQSPLARAQQFARPSTAQPLGARAPSAPGRIAAPGAVHPPFPTPGTDAPAPAPAGREPRGPFGPVGPSTPAGGGRIRLGGGHRR